MGLAGLNRFGGANLVPQLIEPGGEVALGRFSRLGREPVEVQAA